MEKLKDKVSLVGKIETITMMDFRASPGEILTSVEIGETFIVTRNKIPIAVLSKMPGNMLTTVVDKKGKKSYKL